MAAFSAALAGGADAIEFDVHATADGELVVVHDYTLERTTNGNGLVHDSTWSDICHLDAGEWFAPPFTGERIPRLHEVLSLPFSAFELEVKGLPSAAFVDLVCQAVEASGRAASIEITGHDHLMVREIKHRLPGAWAGYFAPKMESWMPERLYQQLVQRSATYGGFDIVHAGLSDLRVLDVGGLHDSGLLVHAAGVNGADHVRQAVAFGADFLTTNDPAEAIQLFGRR